MKPATLCVFLSLLLAGLFAAQPGRTFAAAQSEQEFLRELPPEIAEKTLVHRLQQGEAIPAFRLTTIDGLEISNETIKGKPTLLAFFAIDNETRQERALELLAALRTLREFYGERVNVYGICSDRKGCESPEVKKAGGNLPIMDDTQRVSYALFGIFMMPTTMVVSAQGELLVKLPYSGDGRSALEGWLKVALGEATPAQLQAQTTVAEPERTAEEKQALHHRQLAKVMVQRRMYPQAVEEFAKAAALEPGKSEPLLEQGFILLKLERWAEAEALFLKALNMNPDSTEAVGGLGLALHGQGRDEEALLELEDAVMVTKPLPRVLIALAEIYAARGDKDLALQTYARAFQQLTRDLERCESLEELTE
jgi:tetratricopeptide (TPR) repeat protein